MRDRTIGQPDVLSLALAEPTEHVRRRWIFGLTLASLGMWMATQTPLQVVLALQLQDITPRHKVVALGVVTGVGAISSALATPIVGMLSDRTAHGRRIGRFSGRRHRWTLIMAVLAAVCMVLLAVADHGVRRGPAVVPVQRLPERRVRQPERGHPRPRAGAAARHGVRLGGHADRARPGPGHRPGRGRPRPAPGRQLRHARGADGGAGPAVRPVHPGPPAGAAPPGPVLLAPAGLAPTGSARGSIPISAGPG